VKATRIECDEAWAFCYAKQKNAAIAKAAPERAGDVWTWMALEANTKLIVSYLVGGRDGEYATALMDDLRTRLATRVQLTTDGHRAYLNAVEEAFGDDIDYAMLVKLDGEGPKTEARYSPAECIGARKLRTAPSWKAAQARPTSTSVFGCDSGADHIGGALLALGSFRHCYRAPYS